MKNPFTTAIFSLFVLMMPGFVRAEVIKASPVSAVVAQRIAGLQRRFEYFRSVAARIPEERVASDTIFVLADFWEKHGQRLAQYLQKKEQGTLLLPVSDPTGDTAISRFAGETQSETSIA